MKKFDIPKEKLVELYKEKHLTMFEISELYHVDRTTISNKLKMFEIDIDPTQRKYRILKATPMNKTQKSMIIGSVLGDGSIISSERRLNSYFKVAHCEKQKDYLFWKKEILGNFVNTINKNIDKRGNSIMYGFHTISHQELNRLRDMFYDNNKKVIKEEIGLYLDSLGLATWFMDDGSKSGRGNNYRLSTDGFSKDDNYRLQSILKSSFDLNVKVLEYTRHDKQYYYLFINKRNAINMTEIIKPHIIDCMKYKLMNDCSSTTKCKTPEKDGDIV